MYWSSVHERHLAGLRGQVVEIDPVGLLIGGHYAMFHCERDLMRHHARSLLQGKTAPSVLDIGVGLGVFARAVASVSKPIRYLGVEPLPEVAAMVSPLIEAAMPQDCRIEIVELPWQELRVSNNQFDAAFMDTWPPEATKHEDFAAAVRELVVPSLHRDGRFSFFSSGPELDAGRLNLLISCFEDVRLQRFRIPWSQLPFEWTKVSNQFMVPVASRPKLSLSSC